MIKHSMHDGNYVGQYAFSIIFVKSTQQIPISVLCPNISHIAEAAASIASAFDYRESQEALPQNLLSSWIFIRAISNLKNK